MKGEKKVCGKLNQSNQPCLRIGICPYHDSNNKIEKLETQKLKIVNNFLKFRKFLKI
jgi:hypothetical protein